MKSVREGYMLYASSRGQIVVGFVYDTSIRAARRGAVLHSLPAVIAIEGTQRLSAAMVYRRLRLAVAAK